MAPTGRIRPYKDFLTPALHRRFMRAAVFLLATCYFIAVFVGEWNSYFWSWLPFGKAGLRTGMLFISAFLIFILRVAQLHAGIRTTSSPVSTLKEYAFRWETIQTAIWYLGSGWLFSEIFIFSAPHSANIRWITDAKNNERPRLNERPIYLMTYFLLMALIQAGVHLAYDYDKVQMPVHKTDKDNTARKAEEASINETSPRTKVLRQMATVLQTCFTRTLAMSIATPFIYSLFIRRTAWSYTLGFAKIIWNLPKSTAIPAVAPYHWRMMIATFWSGFLLVLMWEVANLVFSTYVAQAPLKNDRPITYESKDSNGSLLAGLNGKKLQTRAFAFWELVLIAERFQGRRKVIFEDIDRKGGSAWKQILAACTNVLEDMNYRVATRDPMAVMTAQSDDFKTEKTPQALSMILQDGATQPVEPMQTLPRLTRDIQKENLFSQPPPPKTMTDKFGRVTHELADRYGHSQTTEGTEVKRLVEKAKAAALTPQQQEEYLTPQGIWAMVAPHVTQLLKGPAGWPFIQTFRRRVAAVVLGKPYGDVGIIVDAADALSRFAVASLKEDNFGNVQKDVPGIINLLTKSIVGLEQLRATFGMHWTDVSGERSCEELDTVLRALRSALKDIVEAFNPYFDDMRVSRGDARAAEEAMVAKEVGNEDRVEMKEAKKSR